MKKRFFAILIFTFVLATAVCLTACGDENERKFYYSADGVPAHCRVEPTPYGVENDGKMYVNEGETVTINVYVDEGYYSDDFKMLVNGSEVALTPTTGGNGYIVTYSYSFKPKSDIKVSFAGEFKPIRAEISFATSDAYDATAVSDVYIRFAQNSVGLPTASRTVPQFEAATRNFKRELPYGEQLEFYAYTIGYDITRMPWVINCEGNELNSYFYRDEAKNEYGVRYVYTQGYANRKFEISTTWSSGFSIRKTESDWIGNNITSDKLRIECRDNAALIITLKNYANIPDDVLTALKLKINERDQDIDFKTGANDNGVFTIELKDPYEYYSEENLEISRAYEYDFDLNFYTLDYFDGIEFEIFFE